MRFTAKNGAKGKSFSSVEVELLHRPARKHRPLLGAARSTMQRLTQPRGAAASRRVAALKPSVQSSDQTLPVLWLFFCRCSSACGKNRSSEILSIWQEDPLTARAPVGLLDHYFARRRKAGLGGGRIFGVNANLHNNHRQGNRRHRFCFRWSSFQNQSIMVYRAQPKNAPEVSTFTKEMKRLIEDVVQI